MKPGQSLSGGAAGIALLHIEQARGGAATWDQANATLIQAVADGVSIAATASLYYGAPALSFVLHGVADRPGLATAMATADAGTAMVTRHRLEAAHARIDQRRRPLMAEYDLIGGLTGLAVALRRSGDHDLLRDVLGYLVRLTEPVDGLPGWWCPTGPNRSQKGPIGGHSNHSIAHGIVGPLALLAIAFRDGIEVDGQTDAITRICRWLDAWEQQKAGGGSWWPQIVTLADIDRGTTSQPGPLRPSWCYGIPGITRALQLAARALHDPARQQHAETAFLDCLNDPEQLGRLIDRSLCHGTGGLLATARSIAADALIPIPLTQPLLLHQNAPAQADEPSGFLVGSAGAALAAAGTRTTSWDAGLLLR
ncbi:lanthionine synthetase C family protein [Protofrankia coriariae]|uniref:Lanthionine synthetase n=1 Tax=Protofrankia coriariae TaxID=1562887 RepID=A0ABR5F1N0_9ACTN|nr:lanthionine synthetase C family protein [Protofrankia coriariae]KLL10588.1 lanthionine synthetase [Protofrankia coriariae]